MKSDYGFTSTRASFYDNNRLLFVLILDIVANLIQYHVTSDNLILNQGECGFVSFMNHIGC